MSDPGTLRVYAEKAALIRRIGRALRPGGLAYVAMKIGECEGRDHPGRRYAYVSQAELIRWLEAAGLETVTSRTGHGKGLAGTDDPYVTVTARG